MEQSNKFRADSKPWSILSKKEIIVSQQLFPSLAESPMLDRKYLCLLGNRGSFYPSSFKEQLSFPFRRGFSFIVFSPSLYAPRTVHKVEYTGSSSSSDWMKLWFSQQVPKSRRYSAFFHHFALPLFQELKSHRISQGEQERAWLKPVLRVLWITSPHL